MELAFEDKALRTICENDVHAQHELGQEIAENLKRRLADLRAAVSVHDLPLGNPRVNESNVDEMMIDIGANARLVFTANHPKNPRAERGEVAWDRVVRLKLLRIES